VIAEVFRLSVANVSAVGGGSGTSLTALRAHRQTTRVSVTSVVLLSRSRPLRSVLGPAFAQGLALLAIRDSEVHLKARAVNVRATTSLAWYLLLHSARTGGGAVFSRQPAHFSRRGLP